MLPCRDDRATVEERAEEGVRIGVVLAPAGALGDRDVLRRGLDRRVRALDRARREGDADLLRALLRSPAASSCPTARVSTIRSTFLHSLAPHVPFLSVSYFEPFIAAFALATLPRSPGVLYGAYSASRLPSSASGMMWFATLPMRRAAPRLDERVLVHDPVHRPANVDVVERRLGEVHRAGTTCGHRSSGGSTASGSSPWSTSSGTAAGRSWWRCRTRRPRSCSGCRPRSR